MAYRRALHPPKGSWGRFLDQMRQERGWSAVQAWENLHPVFGLSPKSAAVYKAVEAGTRPVSEEEAAALRDYFGRGPSEVDLEPAVADPLAAAIRALADELRDWRTEDRVRIAALERFHAGAARRASPRPSGDEESPGPRAPRKNAG